MPLGDVARILIILGLLLVVLGVIFALASRVPWLGHLPGDIWIERGNFRLYAPIATSLLISLVLTLLLNLLWRR